MTEVHYRGDKYESEFVSITLYIELMNLWASNLSYKVWIPYQGIIPPKGLSGLHWMCVYMCCINNSWKSVRHIWDDPWPFVALHNLLFLNNILKFPLQCHWGTTVILKMLPVIMLAPQGESPVEAGKMLVGSWMIGAHHCQSRRRCVWSNRLSTT